MSLAAQVLCQRMLIGPCARTIVGARAVAAAPAAATLRKRRRPDRPSLLDLVMISSLLDGDPSGNAIPRGSACFSFQAENLRRFLGRYFGENFRRVAARQNFAVSEHELREVRSHGVISPPVRIWRRGVQMRGGAVARPYHCSNTLAGSRRQARRAGDSAMLLDVEE